MENTSLLYCCRFRSQSKLVYVLSKFVLQISMILDLFLKNKCVATIPKQYPHSSLVIAGKTLRTISQHKIIQITMIYINEFIIPKFICHTRDILSLITYQGSAPFREVFQNQEEIAAMCRLFFRRAIWNGLNSDNGNFPQRPQILTTLLLNFEEIITLKLLR